MVSKPLIASISPANAHAGVNPALGVKGQMVRSDIQRPSADSPCGKVNVAQNLDSSTAVQPDANGNVSLSITDINGGAGSSRSIQEVKVDAFGTGKNLVAAKMVVNGNANPVTVGTDKLTAQFDSGIKCTGGADKNLCLASFTTTAGFRNCVIVPQGAGASNASAPASRSILLRNRAAKGMNSSTSPSADGDKKSQNGKKGKENDKKEGKKDDKKGGTTTRPSHLSTFPHVY